MTGELVDSIPPEAQETDIGLQEDSVYGPGGVSFGKVKGLQNFGVTTVDQFVQDNADAFADLRGSLLRVVQAVSVNEGKLQALNTWDSAYISYGVFQWTAGAGNEAGELAGLLDRLRSESPDLFQKYFGAYGLGVEMLLLRVETFEFVRQCRRKMHPLKDILDLELQKDWLLGLSSQLVDTPFQCDDSFRLLGSLVLRFRRVLHNVVKLDLFRQQRVPNQLPISFADGRPERLDVVYDLGSW